MELEFFCSIECNEDMIYATLQRLQESVLVLMIALFKPVIGDKL